jgi:hypothetical protein
MRRRGHERTGRGHERNDYWLDENGSDLRLVRTRYEERWGGGVAEGDRSPLRSPYSCRDDVPTKERVGISSCLTPPGRRSRRRRRRRHHRCQQRSVDVAAAVVIGINGGQQMRHQMRPRWDR